MSDYSGSRSSFDSDFESCSAWSVSDSTAPTTARAPSTAPSTVSSPTDAGFGKTAYLMADAHWTREASLASRVPRSPSHFLNELKRSPHPATPRRRSSLAFCSPSTPSSVAYTPGSFVSQSTFDSPFLHTPVFTSPFSPATPTSPLVPTPGTFGNISRLGYTTRCSVAPASPSSDASVDTFYCRGGDFSPRTSHDEEWETLRPAHPTPNAARALHRPRSGQEKELALAPAAIGLGLGLPMDIDLEGEEMGVWQQARSSARTSRGSARDRRRDGLSAEETADKIAKAARSSALKTAGMRSFADISETSCWRSVEGSDSLPTRTSSLSEESFKELRARRARDAIEQIGMEEDAKRELSPRGLTSPGRVARRLKKLKIHL